jgi:hypothetical protein
LNIYKEEIIGKYFANLLVEGRVIVDYASVERTSGFGRKPHPWG